MEDNLIEIDNLQVSFFTKLGEVKAVDGVSYSIKKGEVMGVVGESGCGKSVSSYCLMGLIQDPGRVVGGKITFAGQNITQLSEEQYGDLRGKKMAMIFQEPMTALNPVLTIGYQIREQIMRHESVRRVEADERACDLLDLVGIPSPRQRKKEYPHQLSGGMKQRAMIAMALSCNPAFLIADEPTTALDVTIQAQILDLIQSLQENLKMTVQFITHDLGVISELADNVVVMYAGKIVESGKSEKIFAQARHPYTVGLLSSIPQFNNRCNQLYTIPGNVPSPLELPIGCSFVNRCQYAQNRCRQEKPTMQAIDDSHQISCFYPVD